MAAATLHTPPCGAQPLADWIGVLDHQVDVPVQLGISHLSVGLVGGQQGGVHGLHAGRAGEGAHEPRVDAVHVIDVHAGQEPDGVAVLKVQHADHTLFDLLVGGFGAGVEDSAGEVLDEADALSDPNLLLLRQLGGQPWLTGCGVVHGYLYTLLVGWWRLPGKTGPLRLVQKREVVCTLRRETVPHLNL